MGSSLWGSVFWVHTCVTILKYRKELLLPDCLLCYCIQRGLITYIPYIGITQQTPQKISELSCYSTKASLVQKRRGSDPAQTTLFNRAFINRMGAIKSLSGLIILLLFVDALNSIDYVDSKGIWVFATDTYARMTVWQKCVIVIKFGTVIRMSSEYEVDKLTTESFCYVKPSV